MITLTADETMLATLSQADDQAEIRDKAGRLVGYFTPAWADEESWFEQVKPQLDPAELRRRRLEPGKRLTTREVLEHLKSLTSEEAVRSHLQATLERVAAREGCTTP